ncbi:MAG: hypothetical protein AAB611_03140 [Patescibacteria group bacterium]
MEKVVILVFLLLMPTITSAQGLIPCSGPDCSACHLLVLANNVFIFVNTWSIVVSFFIIAYAGFLMVMFGSNSSKVNEARNMIGTTLRRLAFFLCAFLIMNTLIHFFLGNKVEGNWFKFSCTSQPGKYANTNIGGGTLNVKQTRDKEVGGGTQPSGGGGSGNNYATNGTGACDKNILSRYFSGADLRIAICVCNHESGGKLLTLNDSGLRPATEDIANADYSIGPFQYNLWTCGRCDAAWESYQGKVACLDTTNHWPPYSVPARIKNFSALQACASKVGVKIERTGRSLNDRGGTRVTGIEFDSYTRNVIVPLQKNGTWSQWSTYKNCK